jgi:hypothetical protein
VGWSSMKITRPSSASAARMTDQKRSNADAGTCESQNAKKTPPAR